MSRVRIIPYKAGSRSARALAGELGVLRLKTTNSRFRPRPGDTLINWGSRRELHVPDGVTVLNTPSSVAIASNKLAYYERMAEQYPDIIPPFWTNTDDIPEDAYPIMCRTLLSAHSGEGIVVAKSAEELVPAPLYVKYINKKDEYRVHVGTTNTVISVQRKGRRRDTPDDEVNWMIRNHSNGFVFVRNGVEPPAVVFEAAHSARDATGLDFGAVDVIYNERDDRAYALEINSAPGLEGSTVGEYAEYFRNTYIGG